jgi:hypothetical protein
MLDKTAEHSWKRNHQARLGAPAVQVLREGQGRVPERGAQLQPVLFDYHAPRGTAFGPHQLVGAAVLGLSPDALGVQLRQRRVHPAGAHVPARA